MIPKFHNLLQKMLRVVKRNHITQSHIEKQDLQSENVIQFTQRCKQKTESIMAQLPASKQCGIAEHNRIKWKTE